MGWKMEWNWTYIKGEKIVLCLSLICWHNFSIKVKFVIFDFEDYKYHLPSFSWSFSLYIFQDPSLALRKEGLGVVLDSNLPHLIGIDDDILSTGIMLYHLKVHYNSLLLLDDCAIKSYCLP